MTFFLSSVVFVGYTRNAESLTGFFPLKKNPTCVTQLITEDQAVELNTVCLKVLII